MELFQQFLNKARRGYGQVDKNIFGGLLPGGAASVVSPAKQQIKNVAETGIKTLAGTAMNQLPDRANLFARYVAGVGNTNLQLDPSTLGDLRAAATYPPFSMGMVPNPLKMPDEILMRLQRQLNNARSDSEAFNSSPLGKFIKAEVAEGLKNRDLPDFIRGPIAGAGPGLVASGPVSPYGRPNIGTSVTNTLGSYNVEVNPGKSITFKDVYDMVNPGEDPDLVSGKFQPIKAIEEIQSIWDPTKGYFARNNRVASPPPGQQTGYGQMRETKSQFASPATALGRALLYALPVKPQPYDVNITVPY